MNILTWGLLRRGTSITLGAVVAAIGLEAFLIPNHLTDGGVVGVSIVSSHVSGLPIGIFGVK